jgi:hypothetical protein
MRGDCQKQEVALAGVQRRRAAAESSSGGWQRGAARRGGAGVARGAPRGGVGQLKLGTWPARATGHRAERKQSKAGGLEVDEGTDS